MLNFVLLSLALLAERSWALGNPAGPTGICQTELGASPFESTNPFEAIFADSGVVKAALGEVGPGLTAKTADQKAEALLLWIQNNKPHWIGEEQKGYFLDVIEASYPLFETIKSSDLASGQKSLTFFSTQMAQKMSKNKFKRSQGKFQKTVTPVSGPSRADPVVTKVLEAESAISKKIMTLKEEVINPETWGAISQSVVAIRKEMQERNRVPLRMVVGLTGAALLNSHEKMMKFRSQFLQLSNDLTVFEEDRKNTLLMAERMLAAQNQKGVPTPEALDFYEKSQGRVIVLQQMAGVVQTNVSILNGLIGFLDSLEISFESMRVQSRPNFESSFLTKNDPAYKALLELQKAIDPKAKN